MDSSNWTARIWNGNTEPGMKDGSEEDQLSEAY